MSEANGTSPEQQPEQPADEQATPGERFMGLVGIIFAAVVGAIGFDLLTGGALSRAFGLGPVSDADQRP